MLSISTRAAAVPSLGCDQPASWPSPVLHLYYVSLPLTFAQRMHLNSVSTSRQPAGMSAALPVMASASFFTLSKVMHCKKGVHDRGVCCGRGTAPRQGCTVGQLKQAAGCTCR